MNTPPPVPSADPGAAAIRLDEVLAAFGTVFPDAIEARAVEQLMADQPKGDDEQLIPAVDATEELKALRATQRKAMQALMGNRNYSEAANAAGVDRRTLNRWMKNDPVFIKAVEAWRGRTVNAARDCLIQSAHSISMSLSLAAVRGNVPAMIAILKGVGVIQNPSMATQTKPATSAAKSKADRPAHRTSTSSKRRKLPASPSQRAKRRSSRPAAAPSPAGDLSLASRFSATSDASDRAVMTEAGGL